MLDTYVILDESRWEVERIDSKENLIRLVNQYQNLIFSICLKLTGDYFAAEDLAQETFIAAFRNWEKFDGGAEKAWLCRIAANKCIDYNRLSASKELSAEEEEIHKPEACGRDEPLEWVMNREVMEELERCCRNLPPPYDRTARQHFIEGKPAKEIAEQTETELNTVKTRIRRAREMLKKSFRKELLRE